MKRFYLQLLLAIFCCSVAFSCKDDEPDFAPAGNVDVHVILGQSNALGRAPASELPAELRSSLKECYIFNKASNKFEVLHAGVNTQSDDGQFGPVVKAAQLLREYKKKPVYFVVFGVGGSQLYQSPNAGVQDWNVKSNKIYVRALQTIDSARTVITRSGATPVIKSITWWQGESDAKEKIKADVYQANEKALFDAFDKVSSLKDARHIVFKIFDVYPYTSTVNSAKVRRASGDKKTAPLIEVEKYERMPGDKLHANANGQVQAGTDLFNLIKDL